MRPALVSPAPQTPRSKQCHHHKGRLRLHNGWISGGLLAIALAAASGCATGSRPTLAEETSTGYVEVDDLIDRVGQLSSTQYSAHYDVLVRFGDTTTDVSASQSDGDRRSLTIGDVRFVVHGSITKTCTVSTGACIGSIDPARVSDVQMTPDFFGTSLMARIRLDASRAVGNPVTTSEDIQGQPATCVAIPTTDASTTTYCVFDNGVLARLDAPDLLVTMTGYSTEVDETLYGEGGTTTTAAMSTTVSSTVDPAADPASAGTPPPGAATTSVAPATTAAATTTLTPVTIAG
jgi:hypothetical protein